MNEKDKMTPLVVLWDGDCGFCLKSLDWVKSKNPEGKITYLSFHADKAKSWCNVIGIENLQKSMYVIKENRPYPGAEGFQILLLRIPNWRWLGTLMGWPVIKQIGQLGYLVIAKNRTWLGKHSCKLK